MNTGCRAIGIEKEEARYQASLRLLQQCKEVDPSLEERVQFLSEDLMCNEVDLSEATVIYVNNWCFSEELQLKLLDHFQALKPGTRIVTLKTLFGQRSSKRRKLESILKQEPSINGPAGSASWTPNPIACYVYRKIA